MGYDQTTLELSTRSLPGGVLVIAAAGELHLSTAPELRAEIERDVAAGGGPVVFDLTGLEFVDSTGLGVLLSTLRTLTLQRRALAIACANPTVLRLFAITQLDRTFDLHATVEAAADAVRGVAPGARS